MSINNPDPVVLERAAEILLTRNFQIVKQLFPSSNLHFIIPEYWFRDFYGNIAY